MAWTYGGDPSANARDWVRFRIGDTDTADQQLSDEEIASLLSDASDAKRVAALYAVRRLLAKYARLVDTSRTDGASDSYSQRRDAYAALAAEIEAEIAELGSGTDSGSAGGGGARITGASLSRRTAVRAKPDRVHPPAFRGQWSREGNPQDPQT